MIASLVLCCAGLVTAAAEGESCLLVASPVAGRTTKVVREVHVSLSPAGAVQVIDGIESKLDKETAKSRAISEREAWEERTVAVAPIEGVTRSVHTLRRFAELERTTTRGSGAEIRQKSVVSPLLGRSAYAKRLDDGTWDRGFEGAADWDVRCLATLDAQPPLGDWLPAGAVKAGDTWELEPAAIERAFRLDVRELLMPLPKGTEYIPPPPSEVPWRAAKWSGSASVLSIDDKQVRLALGVAGEGVWSPADKPATLTVEGDGELLTFSSMEPVEETLTTTLKGELVYDRKLGLCTSLQLKGDLRCSTTNLLGPKGKLVRREQGSFVVKLTLAAEG